MYNYIGDYMSIISRLFKKQKQTVQSLTQDELLEILIKNYSSFGFEKEDYENIVRNLNIACISCGGKIDNVKLVHIGQDAIILECNNTIIKITTLDYGTNTLTEYIKNCDIIQKPITEQEIKIKERKITILTEKKLSVEKIKPRDIYEIYSELRDNGYLWYDPKPENIGRDDSGKLLLLDYGQIIYINNMSEYDKYRELETHKNMFEELNNSYEQAKQFEVQFGGKKK